MKKNFGKIFALCLCAALLFGLAACREFEVIDFDLINLVPHNAQVLEASDGHKIMEINNVSALYPAPMDSLIEFYELVFLRVGSKEIKREAEEGYWSYTGSYPGNRVLRVTIRYMEGDTMLIFVRFLDELTN